MATQWVWIVLMASLPVDYNYNLKAVIATETYALLECSKSAMTELHHRFWIVVWSSHKAKKYRYVAYVLSLSMVLCGLFSSSYTAFVRSHDQCSEPTTVPAQIAVALKPSTAVVLRNV
ncbi:hypothetical protein CPB85DRAFT_1459125 [Mucidula mucida]|nr:hypothetical protein CPB85DRAFT_1459125 [Mucidula mucida]